MTAIDPTKARIDALDPSPLPLPTPNLYEIDVANTPLPHCMSGFVKSVGPLRDAPKRNDRQVLPAAAMLDDQLHDGTGSPPNERVRLRARRAARPSIPRLEAWPTASGERTEVDLVRGACPEPTVRPLRVVPGDVVIELATERGLRQGHDRQQPRALVLHRLDESLDDGEAAVLPDGAESLLDAATAAPRDERVGGELRTVIGDEVAGPMADLPAESVQEGRHLAGGRLLLEVRGSHGTSRKVIDDDRDPPTERPALGNGERPPGDPESADGGNGRQVEMPNAIGAFGGDDPGLRRSAGYGFGLRSALDHPTDCRCAEVQSRPREHASDPTRSHPRAQRPQAANHVADELGEPIDGIPDLDERVRAFVVETVRPRGDGERGDEEASRGLGLRPAARRAKLQDRKPFDRRVMGPALCGQPLHAGVLDAELLEEHDDLAVQPIVGRLQAGADVEVILDASLSRGEGDVRHRDGVDDGGADEAGPVSG